MRWYHLPLNEKWAVWRCLKVPPQQEAIYWIIHLNDQSKRMETISSEGKVQKDENRVALLLLAVCCVLLFNDLSVWWPELEQERGRRRDEERQWRGNEWVSESSGIGALLQICWCSKTRRNGRCDRRQTTSLQWLLFVVIKISFLSSAQQMCTSIVIYPGKESLSSVNVFFQCPPLQ